MSVVVLPQLWMPPKREFVKPSFNFIRNLMSPLGMMGPNNPYLYVIEDASSPTAVTNTTTSTLSTASFVPPAGSLIVAVCITGDPAGDNDSSNTVIDSLSGSWTRDQSIDANGGIYEPIINIYHRTTAVTNTAITVDLEPSGTHPAGNQLTVKVLTGQAASPVGAVVGSNTITAANISITPQAVGSYVIGGFVNQGNGTFVLVAETGITTILATEDSGDSAVYGSGKLTSPSSRNPVTFGWTNSVTLTYAVIAAVEYKAL